MLTPIDELLDDPRSRDVLVGHLPMLAADGLRRMVGHLSPYRLAAMTPAISADQLCRLEADLATADTEVPA